jgi:hypothetical protein
VNVKKVGCAAALVGALSVPALLTGAGVAAADESLPASPGIAWKLGPHDHWWGGPPGPPGPHWRGGPPPPPPPPAYYRGACAWVPPAVSIWVPPAVC